MSEKTEYAATVTIYFYADNPVAARAQFESDLFDADLPSDWSVQIGSIEPASTDDEAKSQGQLDYEARIAIEPTYPDGRPRRSWDELSDRVKASWEEPYQTDDEAR